MNLEIIRELQFIGSSDNFNSASILLWGVGFDGTTSLRPGTRFGPQAIRLLSDGLELYSPYLDIDFEQISYFDLGDLDLTFGDTEKSMQQIESHARELLQHPHKKLLTLGGEHSITPPLVAAHIQNYPDLIVVQFDAHLDLRAAYKGVKNSHACAMHNVLNLIPPTRLHQIGIRSGTKDEFAFAQKHQLILGDPLRQLPLCLDPFKGHPIYITLDLDVLDPSVLPGTGTPEPGGFSFHDLMAIIKLFKNYRVVGADVVELSPHYDRSDISSITAAKIVRELIGILS